MAERINRISISGGRTMKRGRKPLPKEQRKVCKSVYLSPKTAAKVRQLTEEKNFNLSAWIEQNL
ncbi:MAG: hypothetical protein KBS70_08305 [Bacteroidales bacterium]|nr:hypothetical protein [Candidatus Colicola equi]